MQQLLTEPRSQAPQSRSGCAVLTARGWIAGRWPYAFVTLMLIWAWRPTLGGSAHIPYDLEFFHFPLLATVQRMMLNGITPSWDPGTYGGVPLLANAQSAFAYPPHLLLTAYYGVAGGGLTNHVLSIVSVIHVWIAALGTVALVRARSWGNAAAVVSGTFVALGGFVVAESQHLGMAEALAWLPWAALLCDRCAERVTWWRVGGIASCFFLVLSSGFLPMVIPWAVVLLAIAVARRAGARRAVVATVGGLVLGALLGAVILLPIYALRDYFPPLEPYNTHTLATLVTSVYPNAFGYWAPPSGAGTVNYTIGDYMYVGAAGLLLVPVAVAGGRRVLPEAGLALFVLVLSIGPIGEHISRWVQAVPTVGLLYRPAIMLYVGVLPIALLIGRALERRPGRRELGFALLVMLALSVIPISDSRGHTLHLLGSAPRRELVAAVVGLILLGVAGWRRVGERWAVLLLVAVAVVTAAELTSTVSARFFTNSPGPGTTVAATGDQPLVDWLDAHLAPGRRVIVDAANLSAQWAGFSPLFGLPNANGFQPQFSRFQQARVGMLATGATWRASVVGNASFASRILPVTPAERAYFQEMGVQYILASALPADHFRQLPGYTEVHSLGAINVYRLDPTPPRAWVLAPACLPRAREGVLAGRGCVSGDASVALPSPHLRRYTLSPAAASRTLVTGEPYYPGWSAQSSHGRALAVHRLGYQAAVSVPGGVRSLTMDYTPPGLAAGLVISLLTGAGLLGGGIAVGRRRRR